MRLTCTVRLKTGSNMAAYLTFRDQHISFATLRHITKMRSATNVCKTICHELSPAGTFELAMVCQKIINSSFFNVYIDGRCDKVFKKVIVSIVFRKWPINNCHGVSFKLHTG